MRCTEKTRLLGALAWRNLWRNPRRTGLVLVAVTIGMWSIISFTALLEAWGASSLDSTLKDLTGQGQIHAQGYLDNPDAAHHMAPPSGTLETLLDGPAVAHWAPRVQVPAVVQSAYETMPVSFVGIDPQRERGLSFIPDAVREGKYLDKVDTPGILLGRTLAKRLHIRVGQRVVLMSQSVSGALAEWGFRVIGLFSATPRVEKSDVFVSLGQAQAMLGLEQDITGIAFDLHDMADLDLFIGRLRQAAPDKDIQSWAALRPMAKAVNQLSDSFNQVWIVIMFVLMAFGIINTLRMALHERVRELALLQALGLRPLLILAQVMLETALEIFLGLLIGASLAAATVFAFHDGLSLGFLARGAELLGAGRVLYPRVDVGGTLETGLIIWVLGLAACLWPVWRIVRRVPIDAINRSPT